MPETRRNLKNFRQIVLRSEHFVFGETTSPEQIWNFLKHLGARTLHLPVVRRSPSIYHVSLHRHGPRPRPRGAERRIPEHQSQVRTPKQLDYLTASQDDVTAADVDRDGDEISTYRLRTES
jgi:hypothetical protein